LKDGWEGQSEPGGGSINLKKNKYGIKWSGYSRSENEK
jgi:hypothetical protein